MIKIANIPQSIWTSALLIRTAEKHLLSLFSKGKINGTVHTCIGQELVGATFACTSYQKGDFIVSNHRGHGHFLSCFPEYLSDFFAELTSKNSSICGGHGGSQHFYIDGFFSNGILGSTAPIACGIALAFKKQQKKNIVVLFLGDGALAEGVIYEAMNIASIQNLPLYIICESNKIAQSTITKTVQAGCPLKRAEGFGLASFESSTNDPLSHIEVTKQAESLARTGKPVFHLVHTQRLHSHSKGDDTRTESEVLSLWKKDPLELWLNTLEKTDRDKYISHVEDKVLAAYAKSLNMPSTSLAYFERKNTYCDEVKISSSELENSNCQLKKRINNCLDLVLNASEKTVLFGEDVESPYGGAFKITENLSYKYPKQVWNMPISEAAIIGQAIGLSMSGYKAIVEIMFADFLTLGFDQILNSASKFSSLFKTSHAFPLIIRTPVGARRGYGATHSQSPEKYFLGIPNLKVYAINYLLPANILKEIYTPSSLSLILENKSDYARNTTHLDGFNTVLCRRSFDITLKPKCPANITLLCYGGMLSYAKKAAKFLLFEYEIAIEVICVTKLYPFNDDNLIKSVTKTQKLLCVEEGTEFANFSSQAIAQLHEKKVQFCSKTLSSNDSVISSALTIEEAQLPTNDSIISTILHWSM